MQPLYHTPMHEEKRLARLYSKILKGFGSSFEVRECEL